MSGILDIGLDDQKILDVVAGSILFNAILTVLDANPNISLADDVVNVVFKNKPYKLPFFEKYVGVFSYEKMIELLKLLNEITFLDIQTDLDLTMQMVIEPLYDHLSIVCTELLRNHMFIRMEINKMAELAKKDYIANVIKEASFPPAEGEESHLRQREKVISAFMDAVLDKEGVEISPEYAHMILEIYGVILKCGDLDLYDYIPPVVVAEGPSSDLKRRDETGGGGGKRTKLTTEETGAGFFENFSLESSSTKYRRLLLNTVFPALLDALDYSRVKTAEFLQTPMVPPQINPLAVQPPPLFAGGGGRGRAPAVEETRQLPPKRKFGEIISEKILSASLYNSHKSSGNYELKEESIEDLIEKLQKATKELEDEDVNTSCELTIRNVAWVVEFVKAFIVRTHEVVVDMRNVNENTAIQLRTVMRNAVTMLDAFSRDTDSFPDTKLIRDVINVIVNMGMEKGENPRALFDDNADLFTYQRIIATPNSVYRRIALADCYNAVQSLISPPAYLTEKSSIDNLDVPYEDNSRQRNSINTLSDGALKRINMNTLLWSHFDEIYGNTLNNRDSGMNWIIVKKDKLASVAEIAAQIIYRLERFLYMSDSFMFDKTNDKTSIYQHLLMTVGGVPIEHLPTNNLTDVRTLFSNLFPRYYMARDAITLMQKNGGTYEMWARHFSSLTKHINRIKTQITERRAYHMFKLISQTTNLQNLMVVPTFYSTTLRETHEEDEQVKYMRAAGVRTAMGLVFLASSSSYYLYTGDIPVWSFSTAILVSNAGTLMRSFYKDFFVSDDLTRLEVVQHHPSSWKAMCAITFFEVAVGLLFRKMNGSRLTTAIFEKDVVTSFINSCMAWTHKHILYVQASWFVSNLKAITNISWLPVKIVKLLKASGNWISRVWTKMWDSVESVYIGKKVSRFLNFRDARKLVAFILSDLVRMIEYESLVSRLVTKTQAVAAADIFTNIESITMEQVAAYFKKAPRVITAFDMLAITKQNILDAEGLYDSFPGNPPRYANTFGVSIETSWQQTITPLIEQQSETVKSIVKGIARAVQYLGYIILGSSYEFGIEIYTLTRTAINSFLYNLFTSKSNLTALPDGLNQIHDVFVREYGINVRPSFFDQTFDMKFEVPTKLVEAYQTLNADVELTIFGGNLFEVGGGSEVTGAYLPCEGGDPLTTVCETKPMNLLRSRYDPKKVTFVRGEKKVTENWDLHWSDEYLVKTGVSIPRDPTDLSKGDFVLTGKGSVFDNYMEVVINKSDNLESNKMLNRFKVGMFPDNIEGVTEAQKITQARKAMEMFFYKLFVHNPQTAFNFMAQQKPYTEEFVKKIPDDFIYDICTAKHVVLKNLAKNKSYKTEKMSDEQVSVINDLLLSTREFLTKAFDAKKGTASENVKFDFVDKNNKMLEIIEGTYVELLDHLLTQTKARRVEFPTDIDPAKLKSVVPEKTWVNGILDALKDTYNIEGIKSIHGKEAGLIASVLMASGNFTIPYFAIAFTGYTAITAAVAVSFRKAYRPQREGGGGDQPEQQRGWGSMITKGIFRLFEIGAFAIAASHLYTNYNVANASDDIKLGIQKSKRLIGKDGDSFKKQKATEEGLKKAMDETSKITAAIKAVVDQIVHYIASEPKLIEFINKVNDDMVGSGFFLDRLSLFAKKGRTRIFLRNTRRNKALDNKEMAIVPQSVEELIENPKYVIVKKEIVEFLKSIFTYKYESNSLLSTYTDMMEGEFDETRIYDNWRPLLELLIIITWKTPEE